MMTMEPIEYSNASRSELVGVIIRKNELIAQLIKEVENTCSDLATARQAMLDSIGFANARPGCECPICKWLAEHPQKGETK